MTHFETVLPALYKQAEEELGKAIAAAQRAAANNGNLGASRCYFSIQELINVHIDQYAKKLSETLTEYDPQHSPTTKEDFASAKESVKKYSEFGVSKYNEKLQGQSSGYKNVSVPFNQENLTQTVSIANSLLDGKKFEFDSKTSFLKWALGDAQKKGFTAILSLTAASIGVFLPGLWKNILLIVEKLF